MKFIFVITAALAIFGCKSRNDRSSEGKAIVNNGMFSNDYISAGSAIGPFMSPDGRVTLIVCKSLALYEQAFKDYSGRNETPWHDLKDKCNAYFYDRGVAVYLTSTEAEVMKGRIHGALWTKCLKEQWWFCDESKIKAEVDAAFSSGNHMGAYINGADWLKQFYLAANYQTQTLMPGLPCMSIRNEAQCAKALDGRVAGGSCAWESKFVQSYPACMPSSSVARIELDRTAGGQ